MKRFLASFLLPIVLSGPAALAQAADASAEQLAQAVWEASGGENWSKVEKLHFTFIVEQDGKELVSVEHDWNVAAGTDRVRWKGKDVTVNLAQPGQDEDAQGAYARWVNDSYWLLAPLKLRDRGVKLTAEGKEEKDGLAYDLLRLSFEGVGLTPGDQYLLYIDPAAKLVRAWDYIPKAETVMHSTWEQYENFGGLNLATSHNFAGKVIRFANIKVE